MPTRIDPVLPFQHASKYNLCSSVRRGNKMPSYCAGICNVPLISNLQYQPTRHKFTSLHFLADQLLLRIDVLYPSQLTPSHPDQSLTDALHGSFLLNLPRLLPARNDAVQQLP